MTKRPNILLTGKPKLWFRTGATVKINVSSFSRAWFWSCQDQWVPHEHECLGLSLDLIMAQQFGRKTEPEHLQTSIPEVCCDL